MNLGVQSELELQVSSIGQYGTTLSSTDQFLAVPKYAAV
jgi:hypothetical protein